MDYLYTSFSRVFGPLVQMVASFFVLFLTAWCVGAAGFWSERKLAQTGNRVLGMLPFPILILGFLYGGLRFSGQLLYPTDGWDQWGFWNYTYQNCGMCLLFLCVCLLIGIILAIYKENTTLKN